MEHDLDQNPGDSGFSNQYAQLRPDAEHVQEHEAEHGTPDEELRITLSEACGLLGSTRSFDATRIPLEVARRMFPQMKLEGEEGFDEAGAMKAEFSGIAIGTADVVEVPGYQRHDHSVYLGHSEPAGLTVSVTERSRYFPGEAVEPIRAGIDLTNESGSLFIGVTVPSQHGGETPNELPMVKVSLSDGADLERMLAAAKDGLVASALDPGGSGPTPQVQAKLIACLDYLKPLLAATGIGAEEHTMSEEAMLRLDAWENLYFYDTRPKPTSQQASPDNPEAALAHTPAEGQAEKGPGSRAWGRRTIESLDAVDRRVYPYGEFPERLNYEDGLTVSKELSQGNVVSWVAERPDRSRYRIFIGRTPQDFSTVQPGAGRPGEFLLMRQELDRAEDGRYVFLDPEDVQDVEVIPGEEVSFTPNNRRGRQVKFRSSDSVQKGVTGYR